MVMVVGCCDVDTIEVDSVTTGGRCGESMYRDGSLGSRLRSETREERSFKEERSREETRSRDRKRG